MNYRSKQKGNIKIIIGAIMLPFTLILPVILVVLIYLINGSEANGAEIMIGTVVVVYALPFCIPFIISLVLIFLGISQNKSIRKLDEMLFSDHKNNMNSNSYEKNDYVSDDKKEDEVLYSDTKQEKNNYQVNEKNTSPNATMKIIFGSISIIVAVGLSILFYFYNNQYLFGYVKYIDQNQQFLEKLLSGITFLFFIIGILLIISGSSDKKKQKISNMYSQENTFVKTKSKYKIGTIIVGIGVYLMFFQYSHYLLRGIIFVISNIFNIINSILGNIYLTIFFIGVLLVIIGLIVNAIIRKKNKKKELEKHLYKNDNEK